MAVHFFKNAWNTDARHAIFNEVQGDQHNTTEYSERNRSPIDKPHRKIGKHLGPRGTGSTTDAIILVLGASGTGKSKFINMVTGTSELSIGDGLQSCTSNTQSSMFLDGSGRKIRLIDTPGFDHTAKSDIEVLKEIADCLSAMYQKGELLTGVVYMHRGNEFVGRSARRNFNVIQKLCGENALSNVAIVTNILDKASPGLDEGNEAKFGKYDFLFQPVLDKHGQLFRHCDNPESAKSIIYSIIKRNPERLQIQRELVNEHMNLYQTEAGMELTQEFRKQLRIDDDLFNVIQAERRK